MVHLNTTKFVMQVFTIHGLHDDNYVPLIYFHYQTNTLKRMCNYLNMCYVILIQMISYFLLYMYVHIDFESIINYSIKLVLSTAQIKGCRFHLGKS